MNHVILRCVVLPPQQIVKNSRLEEYSGSRSTGHMWVLSEKLGYATSVTGQVLVWDVLSNIAPFMEVSLTWRNCILVVKCVFSVSCCVAMTLL